MRILWTLSCASFVWDRADGFGASHQRQTRPAISSIGLRNRNVRYQTTPPNSDVDDLLGLIQGGSGSSYSKKTPEERERILKVMLRLEKLGDGSRYLDDEIYVGGGDEEEVGGTLLWDSYELAYFDRSIDGDRGSGKNSTERPVDQYKNATRPFGIRSKFLGSLFGLRYSFQHAVRPGRFVNDVGFRVLGLPAAVVAGGNFTRIGEEEVAAIKNETGTELRLDTAVRIDFEKPVMWLGNKRLLPLIVSLGSRAQSPPVTLCTTYMDDKIRLALAAKGGRLVFTRGGKATRAFASDWQTIEGERPLSGGVVGTVITAAAAAAWKLIPSARMPISVAAALPVTLMVRAKLFRGKKGEMNGRVDDDNADSADEETLRSKADDIETDEAREAWLDMVSEIIDEESEIDGSGAKESGAEEVEAKEAGEIGAD